jgi:hypothetical protein
MTEKEVRKAEELIKSKETLDRLWFIIGKPYPAIFKNRRIFFGANYREISFASFDETTREELKKAIRDVINKRTKEIDNELESM